MRTILQRRFLQCRVHQLDKQSALLQYKGETQLSEKHFFKDLIQSCTDIFRQTKRLA